MDPELLPVERSAVLILRVVLDGNPDGGLRARLTRSLDISSRDHDIKTATSVDDVCEGVRSWLETFVSNHGRCSSDDAVTTQETPA